jgi:hypothetical protein
MAIKKRLIRNKPTQGDFGVYTYSENNDSTQYVDSDSIQLRYDKFAGKDLYTTSVGDLINEAIMDSNIQNLMSDPYYENPNTEIDDLQATGESSIRINTIVIKNRGVRTRINDVYFRFFIWSHKYYPPKDSNGNWLGYNAIHQALQGSKAASFFYNQSGPNYNEDGEPGDFPGLQGLKIVQNFDKLNYTGASIPPEKWPHFYSTFDPDVAFQKVHGNSHNMYDDDQTNIFQEDGEYNPCYFAVHMDGDMNPRNGPDRSRNQTLSIYEFNPSDLFDVTPSGETKGKITELTWENHDYQTHSTGKKAPAWTAQKLQMTIDTTGGVSLDSGYTPPSEYLDIVEDIIPPLETAIGENNRFKDMDKIILNMFPNRQIMTKITYSEPPTYEGAEIREYNDGRLKDTAYYMSKFADFLPYAYVNISERDGQIYYQDEENRSYASAPNTIDISFDIARHPEPYDEFCQRRGCYSYFQYEIDNDGRWDFEESIDLENLSRSNEPNPMQGFQNYQYLDYGEQVPGYFNPAVSGVSIERSHTIRDSNYIFFVISWDDVDNQYKTMENVLNDWPREEVDLLKKQSENLYIPNHIQDSLSNHYSTPGIKTIKSILFNYSTELGTDDYAINPEDVKKIEPLRWKLVTTKIYLDIPISQFPDFGELGGADYATIPWPYTAPVIGGTSENSKYSLSIDDTLAGGKLSETDIIDETFLVNAQENDEIGKNIEKLDLEQVRFFNTGSYDMNTILKIPTTTGMVEDTTIDTLQTLNFPKWLNEFDTTLDDELSNIDIGVWEENGRPDIAEWIDNNIIFASLGLFNNEYKELYIPISIRDSMYWPIYNIHKDKLFEKSMDSLGNVVNQDFDYCHNYDLNQYPQYIKYCKPIWPPRLVSNEGEDEYTGEETIDYGSDFTDGCELPPNTIWMDSNRNVLYNFGTQNLISITLTLPSEHGWPNYIIGGMGGQIEESEWETDIYSGAYYGGNSEHENQVIRFERIQDFSGDFSDWVFGNPIGEIEGTSCGTLTYLNLFVTDGQILSETATDFFIGDQADFGPNVNDIDVVNEYVAGVGVDWNQDGVVNINDLTSAAWDGYPIANQWDFTDSPIGLDADNPINNTHTGVVRISKIELYGDFDTGVGGYYPEFLGDVTIGGYNFGDLSANANAGGFWGDTPSPYYTTVFEGSQDIVMVEGKINYSFNPSPHVDGDFLENNNYAWNLKVTFNRTTGEFPNGNGSLDMETFTLGVTGGLTSFTSADLTYYNQNQEIFGCINSNALNYNFNANIDDGSCIFADITSIESFYNVLEMGVNLLPHPYYDISGSSTQISGSGYWTGDDWNSNTLTRTFSTGSLIEQIFINDNSDLDLVSNCKFELNTGDLIGKAINDSSGKLNKGLLIGDFKVKKVAKNQPMRRDDFIKVAKKNNNDDGAL